MGKLMEQMERLGVDLCRSREARLQDLARVRDDTRALLQSAREDAGTRRDWIQANRLTVLASLRELAADLAEGGRRFRALAPHAWPVDGRRAEPKPLRPRRKG